MAVYGTNCLKFAGQDEEQARAMARARAAHRAAEARRRDGRRTRCASSTSSTFPLSRPVEGRLGELQRFTPTIDALFVPDIDASLDEQAAEDRVLERVQGARPLVGGAAAILTRPRIARSSRVVAALAVYFALHTRLPDVSLWWDVAIVAVLVIPGVFATVGLLLPLRREPWRWIAALVCIALAVGFEFLEWQGPASFAKLAAATFVGWLFLDFFEEVSWVVIVALIIPWVDAYSVWRGPTNTIVEHHKGVFERLSFAFPVPGETNTANLGIPDLLFFALFLAAPRSTACGRGSRGC